MPICLSIAGSDSCAGAGIQTDLKAFHANECYGLTAVTAIVSEVPGEVERIDPVPDASLASQIRLLLKHYPVDAIKTGMLHSAAKVEIVANEIKRAKFRGPLVVDPVLVAASGDPLAAPDLVKALHARLLSQASLLTPNLSELHTLTGEEIFTIEALERAARSLAEGHEAPVLAKGGHLDTGDEVIDLLVIPGQKESHRFEQPRIEGIPTHGTGCTLAATLAALLANGTALPDACEQAQKFLNRAIRESHAFGNMRALRVLG